MVRAFAFQQSGLGFKSWQVCSLSPLLKDQHFQIPIPPGMIDEKPPRVSTSSRSEVIYS